MFPIVFLISPSNILIAQTPSVENTSQTAEDVVREVYTLVSFEAGERPDWEKVKSLFIDDAVIVLRSSRTEHSIFSREGFVEDFNNFIDNSGVDKTGFLEKIIDIKPVTIGNIAYCTVIYEASIPGQQRPPQRGVDVFQLINKDGQWLIVSIINEIPNADRPIPDEFIKN